LSGDKAREVVKVDVVFACDGSEVLFVNCRYTSPIHCQSWLRCLV